MAVYRFLTRNGIADQGTDTSLAAIKAELAKPNAKLLLHLHGGLIDEASGRGIADRLSGPAPNGWNLGSEWTQAYVIWRTGPFETIRTNWIDLVHDDRLYQTLLRKLIGFVARKLGLAIPDMPGASRSVATTFALDEAEIQRRITGKADLRDPFADVDIHVGPQVPEGSRAFLTPAQTNGELTLEFQEELRNDLDFNAAVADIDGVVNENAVGRGPLPAGDRARGAASLARLDEKVRDALEPPPVAGTRGIVSVGAFFIEHAGKIAFRCFKRFRSHRDHGLHATIVEEVCREFYGDLVGAKIWGMMVQDAADHFSAGGFGTALLSALPAGQPLHLVVTAHSAGSIWASRMLLAMKAANVTAKVRLILLAPAVRTEVFAEAIAAAGPQIELCRMFTMSDALEAADAVLGHDKGYIYPSSLLYLVSGLFEERDSKAYVDAPLVGMQRFAGASWLEAGEADDGHAIAAFFNQPDNGIVHARAPGICMAVSHGAFDDEPLTLQSAKALF